MYVCICNIFYVAECISAKQSSCLTLLKINFNIFYVFSAVKPPKVSHKFHRKLQKCAFKIKIQCLSEKRQDSIITINF